MTVYIVCRYENQKGEVGQREPKEGEGAYEQ